jgi:tetratricopeptide (TPR) repeat protein
MVEVPNGPWRGYNRRLSNRPLTETFPPADRLESWKEIAAYLRRSERTVRRWEEKEALPVHRLRHDKRGSVYAFTSELDEWRQSRQQLLAAEPDADVVPSGRRQRWPLALAGAAVCAVLVGGLHLFTGHMDLAIAEYQQALAIEPNFGLANHFLGLVYLARGDRASAIAQLRKSNELLGEVPFSLGDLGYALALTGARKEAEQILDDLMRRRTEGYYPAFAISEIQLGLGRVDAALEWLEKAADERHLGYYLPSVDPKYDAVRQNPRFQALMKRLGIPDVAPTSGG